jgi:hypothetical protein
MRSIRAASTLKAAPLVLGLAAGTLFLLRAHYGESATARIPIARAPKASLPVNLEHHGGASPRFTAELVPDAVLVSAGREAIEYHAELASLLEEDGATAWTATVVDDVGNVVSTVGSGQDALKARATLVTPGLVASLADGYYSLRIHAALSAHGTEEVAQTIQYLSVSHGKVREMSFSDWHNASRDGLAVVIPNPPRVPSATGGVK